MRFTLQYEDSQSQARTGWLTTAHGTVQTPLFMPVGTLGSVKGLHQRELRDDLASEMILANAYHLYLRPGMEVLRQAGGLHRFMHWERPILTDSGGYQVYSLAAQRQITEAGVTFASPLDGRKHLFTPERVIELQRTIGADIIMVLDECTPHPCSYAYAQASMERTHRWLQRSIVHFERTQPLYRHPQMLFPIIQGSTYKALRTASADFAIAHEPAGFAIGGVCHPTGQLYEVTGWVCDRLPKDKPRYLMGVGTPADLLACTALGVDLFDCVMPARNGRNGSLFTTQGRINIKNQKWRTDYTPIDDGLPHYASTHYSKAYLHHLIRSGERLGAQIATLQNLALYRWLIEAMRRHIIRGDFTMWKQTILPQLMQRR